MGFVKILLIEDNQELAKSLQVLLKRKGFEIELAFTGNQALNLLYKVDSNYHINDNNYDLVVLDQILPDVAGLDLCQEIKEISPNLPILILSAVSSIDSKVDLFNVGADDYLTKPFAFKELLARINNLLRRNNQQQVKILKVADLSLNCQKQEVIRLGKVIYLTRKEFLLLEYLMRNYNLILTRNMIMEQIWGQNYDFTSNTLTMHIFNLRQKIDVGFSQKLIKTIPSRGYMIAN